MPLFYMPYTFNNTTVHFSGCVYTYALLKKLLQEISMPSTSFY